MPPFCASPFGKVLRQVSRRSVVKWQPGSFQEMNNSDRNRRRPVPHIQEVPRHSHLLMRDWEPKSLTVSRQPPMFDSRPIGNRFRFRISVKKMLRAWRYRHSVKEGVAPMALPSGYERLPRKYLCGVVPSIVRNISMKALTLS